MVLKEPYTKFGSAPGFTTLCQPLLYSILQGIFFFTAPSQTKPQPMPKTLIQHMEGFKQIHYGTITFHHTAAMRQQVRMVGLTCITFIYETLTALTL